MKTLIEGAGHFIWPLGFCSFLAVFIVAERLLALRPARVLPGAITDALQRGDLRTLPSELGRSTAGRILHFFKKNNPDAETLKAFAQIELSRLERGLFLLDTIVSVAPLLGLLGTVYGLFILMPQTTGQPDHASLSHGVGIALTTTVIGIGIAIPALFCSNFIARHLELLSARINLLVERLCALGATTSPTEENTPPLPHLQ
ncbi:MAG: MotA/TolQ/ExbB proton channel family protein [Puniceicoccales bacterium]|jgi:biopolymer transport protein ExbB|nr:MotA/TolQ/ExbB proton channel family protein [Puniceicoccales bacterium]